MHLRFGFQQSFFRETYQIGEEVGEGMADADFFHQTLPRLRAANKPFMAFLMTLSTHHPFGIPPHLAKLRLGDLEGTNLGKYLQTLHYFDSALDALLQELEVAGLLDTTVIAIYGDHREYSLEPEVLERVLTRNAGFPARSPGFDARYWSDGNRLPFIVHLPHDRGAGRRFVTGGHLDIAPTLLNLLGIEGHGMTALGHDLTREEDMLVVFRNGAFILGDTACVPAGTVDAVARCGSVTTGESFAVDSFSPLFAAARERLKISDIILRGDLISRPPASPLSERQP